MTNREIRTNKESCKVARIWGSMDGDRVTVCVDSGLWDGRTGCVIVERDIGRAW